MRLLKNYYFNHKGAKTQRDKIFFRRQILFPSRFFATLCLRGDIFSLLFFLIFCAVYSATAQAPLTTLVQQAKDDAYLRQYAHKLSPKVAAPAFENTNRSYVQGGYPVQEFYPRKTKILIVFLSVTLFVLVRYYVKKPDSASEEK